MLRRHGRPRRCRRHRNGRRDLDADYLYLYDDGSWLAYGIPGEPDWVEIKVEK
ncbi:MAG: hypothetical protein PHQ27_08280 [Victivallales bacterium]|nr:hypothetical protein [Victivallales bacterium]